MCTIVQREAMVKLLRHREENLLGNNTVTHFLLNEQHQDCEDGAVDEKGNHDEVKKIFSVNFLIIAKFYSGGKQIDR